MARARKAPLPGHERTLILCHAEFTWSKGRKISEVFFSVDDATCRNVPAVL